MTSKDDPTNAPKSQAILEFTVEPFHENDPGPHVLAATEAAQNTPGTTTEFGPFGTTVTGERDAILEAARAVLADAFDAGATRVILQVADHPSD